MVLKFSYDPDTAIQPLMIPFNAIVGACHIETIEIPQDFAVAYTEADEELKIQLNASLKPECGYAIKYSVSALGAGVNLPEFIILDSNSGQLTVFSDQSSDVGIYEILVTASVDEQDISKDLKVTVVVQDKIIEKLHLSIIPSDVEIEIG